MIGFLRFFTEQNLKLDPKNYIYSYNDTYIIRTSHGKDQYNDISRAVPKKKKKELFKKAIKYCQKAGKKNQNYVFFVKSTSVGMVVEYREDRKNKVDGNHLIMITWLGNISHKPISKTIHSFKLKFKNDIRVILEQLEIDLTDNEIVELY